MSSLEEVETVTRGRAYLNSLAGRRVTVVGLAKSGVAAARLLRTVRCCGLDRRGVRSFRGGASKTRGERTNPLQESTPERRQCGASHLEEGDDDPR